MKIIGLLRVRNVGEYIDITLGHMATFCDAVRVYDDASDDDTVSKLIDNPLVEDIIFGITRDSNRGRAEFENRRDLLQRAQDHYSNESDVWFVYQDADEFIEWDFSKLRKAPNDMIAVRMRLFDYYITTDDEDQHFLFRRWLGPEYRRIVMVFRNHPSLRYKSFDQREVHLNQPGGYVLEEGFVRHYGKAISHKAWRNKCEYYIREFPKYSRKWAKRLNHPVHSLSSFGNALIQWNQKEERGILLTREIEKNSIY